MLQQIETPRLITHPFLQVAQLFENGLLTRSDMLSQLITMADTVRETSEGTVVAMDDMEYLVSHQDYADLVSGEMARREHVEATWLHQDGPCLDCPR